MARVELMLGRRPMEEGATVADINESVVTLAPVKSNLGRWPRSLNLRIVEAGDSARVDVIGETNSTADDLCAQDKPRTARKTSDAEEVIRRLLADGQFHRQREVEEAATVAGISEKTSKRAKKSMGVTSRQREREWWWQLPPQEDKGGVSDPVAPWPPEADAPLTSIDNRYLEEPEGHGVIGPHKPLEGHLTADVADFDDGVVVP